MVTSNHIHLVVYDDGRRYVISRSMLLVASRTAMDYNIRKKRTGAFWEDNYHATAVESDEHFLECLLYVDLNMVRAGVVSHPKDWPVCGYHEIAGEQKKRYRLIDKTKLMQLLGIFDLSQLQQEYVNRISMKLELNQLKRDKKWTKALAVGSKEFLETYQKKIGLKLHHKIFNDSKGSFILK